MDLIYDKSDNKMSSDLFADDRNSGTSLFGRRTESPNSPNIKKEIKKSSKDVVFPDSTLIILPISVSKHDPQSGQYTNFGQFPLVFVRKNGQITGLVLNPQKQPIVVLACNETLYWEIKNEIYCFTRDSNQVLWLFMFRNVYEALTASIIAFSTKAKIGPVVVFPGEGELDIKKSNIGVISYDLTQTKIEKPNKMSENERIETLDMTLIDLLKDLMNGGIVVFDSGDGMFSIYTFKSEVNVSTGISREPVVESTPAIIQSKTEPTILKKEELKQSSMVENSPPKLVSKNKDSIERQSIEDFENEINNQFEKLFAIVDSIKPRAKLPEYISVSNDRILEKLKNIIVESNAKDKVLEDLTHEIEKYYYLINEKQEKDYVRNQISEIEKKYQNEMNEYKALVSSVQSGENEVKLLIKQIEMIKATQEDNSIEKSMITTHQQRIEITNKEIRHLSDKEESLMNKIKEINQAIVQLTIDNDTLKSMNSDNSEQELQSLKDNIRQTVINNVKEFASGMYGIISEGCEHSREYSSDQCIKALKYAIQEQINNMLNPEEEEN